MDNEEQSKSPEIPAKKPVEQNLTFPEALTAVAVGEKISKVEWGDAKTYGLLKDARLTIYRSDNDKFHDWIVSEGDLLGEDWFVLGR